MPFIKFTTIEQGVSGDRKVLKFLNADKVVSADYNSEDGMLTLCFGDYPGGAGQEFYLHGDEAKQALAILQKL